jgi:ribonuclease P protein component
MKFSDSLKKNKDFDAVYRAGNSKANRDFVMYIKNNGKETNRLGISVSKKVGNSVVRHHLARLIREAYRLHEDEFRIGWDLVIVVRKGRADISYHEVERSLLFLANLLRVTEKGDKHEESSTVSDTVLS